MNLSKLREMPPGDQQKVIDQVNKLWKMTEKLEKPFESIHKELEELQKICNYKAVASPPIFIGEDIELIIRLNEKEEFKYQFINNSEQE